ncbi:MAG: lysophospholipid acyltransferase family protein [Thermodesulfobacteriota bacterium]|nr:lysophospholipid acyltransferase family protein [Thermodesulfobacteriota bacterium]
MKGTGKRIFGKVGLSRFLQWRINTYIVRFLPLALSRAYLCFLGCIYYALNKGERKAIENTIAAIFEGRCHPKEIERTIELTIKGIFTHYHEKLLMPYSNYKWLRSFIFQNIRLRNQGLLDAALKKGRGVILVTGHFGAVEFMPATLALRNYPLAMIVRFKTRRLKEATLELTRQHGVQVLDPDSENISFATLRTLKENRILLTECDEFEAWRPHKDRSIEFLGVTLPVDRTLDALQRKYQSPVIFALLKRGWNGTYVLEFHDVTKDNETKQGFSIAERALSVLENYIYTYPEQWYQWKQAGLFLRPLLQGVMGETDEVKGAGHLSSPHPVFVPGQT